MAPMADITTPSFRKIISKIGKPDVIFTEFIACDGLASKAGRPKLLPKLDFSKAEKPIVAQFFGSKPENFIIAAKMAKKAGFQGIDINMGCPSKTIGKQGAGAVLMTNPALAIKIIKAAKQGAGGLPVSVKTRLGYNENSAELWIKEILKAEPDAIIIHGRTKKQGRKNTADWESIKKAKDIIKAKNPNIIVIGNGDIKTKKEAIQKVKKYGLDGVMIGRAVISNPWFFSSKSKITFKNRIEVAKTHLKICEKENPNNFNLVKKYLKSYFSEFNNAKEVRDKLMEAKNYKEAYEIFRALSF